MIICHSVPGRIRIKVPQIRKSKKALNNLRIHLNQTEYLERSKVRSSTGSVIIFYDSAKNSPDRLFDLLEESLTTFLDTSKIPSSLSHSITIKKTKVEKWKNIPRSLLFQSFYVIALSGFLTYCLAKRFLFKSSLSQGPLSMIGVISMIGSLPLLRRSLIDLHHGKRFGLFPFLISACWLAIITGEVLTALEIIWVSCVSLLLEEYVTERARRAIREILQVTTEDTFVLIDGVEISIPVADLHKGDTLVVRTGQKIPVDGTVIQGEALVDESLITGRSEPEFHKTNDWVYAGAIIREGFLYIRADKLGQDTYMCHICHLLEDSLANRADIEKRADILTVRTMRLGVLATLGTFLITGNLLNSFSVMLIMACPCATVLAASTAVTAAIANAARNHILIKGGVYLEQMHTIDCVCFDKTGTITIGLPEVSNVIPRAPKQKPDRILEMAASAEANSRHPLALSLGEEARRRGLSIREPEFFENFTGRGIRSILDSDSYLLGNAVFMESQDINVYYLKGRAQKYMESGQTVIFVAKNGKLQGMIVLTQTASTAIGDVLNRFKSDGVRDLLLISGDTEPVVKAFSETLGFDDFRAALLPKDKALYIEGIQSSGRRVLMVGDGVNDALALAKATVGVAIGAGGSDVAIEASDIALLKNDLKGLLVVRLLSHMLNSSRLLKWRPSAFMEKSDKKRSISSKLFSLYRLRLKKSNE